MSTRPSRIHLPTPIRTSQPHERRCRSDRVRGHVFRLPVVRELPARYARVDDSTW
jgi:hypothetical protein